jgi:hypothetical protein
LDVGLPLLGNCANNLVGSRRGGWEGRDKASGHVGSYVLKISGEIGRHHMNDDSLDRKGLPDLKWNRISKTVIISLEVAKSTSLSRPSLHQRDTLHWLHHGFIGYNQMTTLH